MSDHIEEQISEFIDDEMSAEECEFFVRRLQRDRDARDRYLRYQLIGVVMRGDHLPARAAGLNAAGGGARLGASGAADDAAESRWRSGLRVAVGTGIAASLALVTILGLRLSGLEDDGATYRATTAEFVGPATLETMAQQAFPMQAEVTGIQYLMHHAGFASGLSRTIMHSSVITGPQADPVPESRNEPLE